MYYSRNLCNNINSIQDYLNDYIPRYEEYYYTFSKNDKKISIDNDELIYGENAKINRKNLKNTFFNSLTFLKEFMENGLINNLDNRLCIIIGYDEKPDVNVFDFFSKILINIFISNSIKEFQRKDRYVYHIIPKKNEFSFIPILNNLDC